MDIAKIREKYNNGDYTHKHAVLVELRDDFIFDGGHGMIFRRNDGVYCLAMHTPNNRTEKHFEHVSIYTLVEKDDVLIIDK